MQDQQPVENILGSPATPAAFKKLFGFALLSGAGLALDLGVFSAMVGLGARAGVANLVSASLAVTFVYFCSAKRVFRYRGGFLVRLFLLYVFYQIVAVLSASVAVDRLSLMGIVPIAAKFMILPITFSANYMFMSFLLRAQP